MKKAVCLISGGLDSYVAATIAKHNGYSIFALTLRYGQKNNREISCAKKISAKLQAEEHLILDIDLSWVDSALTNKKIQIANTYPLSEIPATYVPARNTIFISLAIAFAETIDAEEIYLGINSVDFSGYPDCKPEYIKKFQSLLNVATKKTCEGRHIKLNAPLINLSKSEIIKEGDKLKVDFSITWSCYRNNEKPCGICPSCILREKGFKEANIKDLAIKNK